MLLHYLFPDDFNVINCIQKHENKAYLTIFKRRVSEIRLENGDVQTLLLRMTINHLSVEVLNIKLFSFSSNF